MNIRQFLGDADRSPRCSARSSLFGRSAMVMAVLCLVTGTALAVAEGNDKAGSHENRCTKTAATAFQACRHELDDESSIAMGKCNNLSDPNAFAECRQAAKTVPVQGARECRRQRKGRLELCAALGEAPYDPWIDPTRFVDPNLIGTAITPNPYFPLIRGRTMVYKNGTETIDVTVTRENREILGVTCAVVHDVVKEKGGGVIEDTIDWYAQDIDGNVWYFGEASQEIEDGVPVTIDGSWMAGKNGDKPGFMMKAAPAVGEVYRQEFSLANAEDAAEVLSLTASAAVPAASCSGNCLVTRDFSPIIPGLLEHKYYAPGVGFILEIDPATGDRLELVKVLQD